MDWPTKCNEGTHAATSNIAENESSAQLHFPCLFRSAGDLKMGYFMPLIYPFLALAWACRSVAFAADHITHVSNGGALNTKVGQKPGSAEKPLQQNHGARRGDALNVEVVGGEIEVRWPRA